MNHMDRIIVKIYGRVQGVGFRFAAIEKAKEFGLRGVKPENELDGSLSIRALGEPEELKRFVAWCHVGPPGAKVERVEVEEV